MGTSQHEGTENRQGASSRDASAAAEQDFKKWAEPQKEHQWLQRLVGSWTFEAEASMGPDQPPQRDKGTETVRSIGGLWIMAEGHGKLPDGSPAMNIMTLGYDPRKKRYVGTWVGSMMTHLWIYQGTLDPSGRRLTLETEGPSMSPGADLTKLAKYHDVIEFENDDERRLTSSMLADDGGWVHFMTATYRRKS